jgi:hypothetical protein
MEKGEAEGRWRVPVLLLHEVSHGNNEGGLSGSTVLVLRQEPSFHLKKISKSLCHFI